MMDANTLKKALLDPENLEIGRKAVEDVLIELRDLRILTLRNNGLVVKEFDGTPSAVIRLATEDALRIGIEAIFTELENRKA